MTPIGPRTVGSVGARIPSLGYRILVGTARLVGLLVALVGLPVAALAYLDARGIALPVSIATVTVAGVAISALSTARYVLRPTRAYGPVSLATSVVTVVYLITIWAQGTYRLAVPGSSVSLSVGYTTLLELVLLVPALALLGAVLTTIEDLSAPGERLPFDYPP